MPSGRMHAGEVETDVGLVARLLAGQFLQWAGRPIEPVARVGGPPVWLHGDLPPGNLLCVDGRLRGVIDFGMLGVGDFASSRRLRMIDPAGRASAARDTFSRR